ncbi:MAG: microsomal dipeptidase-like Zn-dependent dipeptidase [Myxococcota bacterium]|jgi:microsomal dipeptidase-like Zn-dependent dipeptidase
MSPLLTALGLGFAFAQQPEPVHVPMDLQGHPAMHLTWKFFGRGLIAKTPRRSHRHQFRQSVYTPWLDDSGLRLFGMAAMAAEKARNPRQARRMVLSEFEYVEAFIDDNSDRYALAKTPAEARTLLAETDKMVIFHSIEGGHHLLNGPKDAAFWRDRGVALFTLMHLRDDELGGSAILNTGLGRLINRAGAKNRKKNRYRGLTERGASAVRELAEVGILVDLSHMAPQTVDDTLAITGELGVPPIVTHGALGSLRTVERSFTDAQVVEIYRQGGMFALSLSPEGLDAVPELNDDVCHGTIESWGRHYQTLVDLVGVDASIGWSSDWNGWVSHAAPVYGKGRCRPLSELNDPLAIDTEGLVHPGMIPQHFERAERMGLDLRPIDRSSEQFLQMWEAVRGER